MCPRIREETQKGVNTQKGKTKDSGKPRQGQTKLKKRRVELKRSGRGDVGR